MTILCAGINHHVAPVEVRERFAVANHELTDVNARFGGAFPLPLAAGGEYPVLALALARGERPEPRVGVFREGVLMTRFFWQVCVGADGENEAVPRAGALSELGTVGRP